MKFITESFPERVFFLFPLFFFCSILPLFFLLSNECDDVNDDSNNVAAGIQQMWVFRSF